MNAESTNPQAAENAGYAQERGMFKALLLTNPNYFGNFPGSKLEPVLPLAGNTYYEELGCVGYQPQQKYLEGVVYVNQPSGYGGDVCSDGTLEFVRFYLSFDGGANWLDQGMTGCRVYDIPEGTLGKKRLEYAVSLPVKPTPKFCTAEPLIKVRAILSWNNPPPPNQPNWPPVWGNVREATILVEPLRLLPLKEIFAVSKFEQPQWLQDTLPVEHVIQTQPKALSVAELAARYENQHIPPHRYAFKEISHYLTAKTTLTAGAMGGVFQGIKIDPEILKALFPKTDGDTSYEELKCVGLDPNLPDTLVGVILVKKPLGYSGGPCSAGSTEYVTFWADFDGNGSFETCLGTAAVQVYDVEIPPQGICYAVRQPVNLAAYRQACKKGPKVVRIRAILSWNVAIPCNQPNKVPVWGNREETLINIAPTSPVVGPAGKIAILGGIPTSMIDPLSGMTTPDAVFATNNLPPDNPDGILSTPDARPCPFAGRVTAQGAPVLGSTYMVEVTPVGGGATTSVVTSLVLTRQDGTTYVHAANPVTHRFTYVDFPDNINSVLAQWDTAGDELWEVRLTTYDAGGNNTGSNTHRVQLDNTWPEAAIEITTGAGNCGKFSIGTPISGRFVARDLHLRRYSLYVSPNVNPAGVGVPLPPSGMSNTAAAPGDSWTLDTNLMAHCGYVIWVEAVDLAIVDSQSLGHYRYASAGFCLELPLK